MSMSRLQSTQRLLVAGLLLLISGGGVAIAEFNGSEQASRTVEPVKVVNVMETNPALDGAAAVARTDSAADVQLVDTVPRRPWVAADGTVDEARAPDPPASDPWLRADGSVDCALVPATIGVATVDGRLLLDRSGREVRVPDLSWDGLCWPPASPELRQAWARELDRLAADDARSNGLSLLPPPKVVGEVTDP